jgi:hypothetical protein
MEALISPTPLLVALLTAIVFLCRAWPRGIHPKSLLPGQSERVPQVPEADDAQAVSKESDFPENWLNSNDISQLERRAVFSKVSPNKHTPGSKFRPPDT